MKPHHLMPCLILPLHVMGCGGKCDAPVLFVSIVDATGEPAPSDGLWWTQEGEEHRFQYCSDFESGTESDTGNWCITYMVPANSGECALRVEYGEMEVTSTIETDLPYHGGFCCPHGPDQYANITVPWSFE